MSTLSAGAYRTNITGPLGSHIEANYFAIPAIHILDELYANALVLDDGQTEIALVSVDVCSVPQEVVAAISAGVRQQCGITPDKLLITATHTHGAPSVGGANKGLYSISAEYVYHFTQQVITAVALAQRRKEPARLGVGRGVNKDFVFNRRLRQPDGVIIMNWFDKKRLQECVAAGPVDPEVLILALEDSQQRPLAFVVNVANHNNAAPNQNITADFSGVMADCLRKIYGDHLVTLFMPGAAGDINWLNHRDFQQYSPTLFHKIGRSLAGTVLQIAGALHYPAQTTLQTAHERLDILERPLRPFDFQDEPTYPKDADGIPCFMGHYKLPYAGIDLNHQQLSTTEVNLHALAIGDEIGIVTNPSEYFVEFGLAIKAKSHFPYTLLFTLTNGCVGYVPTFKALHEGGYEARKIPLNGSWLALDAGDQIADASVRLLEDFAEKYDITKN